MTKITIIMPCLNVASYIKKTVDSIISQTMFENLEILIIDAGSTDGTYEIVSWYEHRYENIRLIKSEKKSYGYQVDIGIKEARGKYVAILETDDYVREDMYEILYDKAERNQVDYIKADFTNFYVSRNGKLIEWDTHLFTDKTQYNKVIDTRESEYIHRHDFSIWKGIYNREFLLNNEIFLYESRGAAYQDIGFGQLLHSSAKRAYYLEDCLYQYRHGRDGSSVNSGRGIIYAYGEFSRLFELAESRYLYLPGVYEAMLSSFLGEFSLITDIYNLENDLEMKEGMDWLISKIDEGISSGVIQMEHFRTEDIDLFCKIKENPVAVARDAMEQKNKRIMQYLSMSGDGCQHIVFGAGKYGKYALMQLDQCGVRVDIIWDNGASVSDIAGIPVKRPDKATLQDGAKIIIANKYHCEEIRLQLVEMGVKQEQILVYSL
ncbi:MAG: glycosyltransferase [Lachnospiraceae bacterium]|nr:glycosyltransferase [Lachnospiraceae bacterium]